MRCTSSIELLINAIKPLGDLVETDVVTRELLVDVIKPLGDLVETDVVTRELLVDAIKPLGDLVETDVMTRELLVDVAEPVIVIPDFDLHRPDRVSTSSIVDSTRCTCLIMTSARVLITPIAASMALSSLCTISNRFVISVLKSWSSFLM